MSKYEFAVYAIAGAAAGYYVGSKAEPLTVQLYSHEQLAHRVTKLHRIVAAAANASLLAVGITPHRIADEHRRHHAVTDREPLNLQQVVGHILGVGISDRTSTEKLKPVLYEGMPAETDPLYRTDKNGEWELRHGPVEKWMKSPQERAIVLAATVGAEAAFLKLVGSKHPLATAAGFTAGYLGALSSDVAKTVYAEYKGGIHNGKFDPDSVPPVFGRYLEIHQIHHDDPASLTKALRPKDVRYLRPLKRMNLITVEKQAA